MKKILARTVRVADWPLPGPQLLQVADDGKVLAMEPFRAETPSTVYHSGPVDVTSEGYLQCDPANYNAALEALDALGAFHSMGAQAYKPGLERIAALDSALGAPASRLAVVHVAGTNGKGSTASTIAAVLTAAGYRTGLYTSPHLVDFRERIRIDGRMIPREAVLAFVRRLQALDNMRPSYFEAVTAMAFDYFCRAGVDVAVVEVGLGGRLDSTNIVSPLLSVVTNISLDHTAILGDTVEKIAAEKAGIIKPGVPVVIGRADGAVREVFAKAAEAGASLAIFAQDNPLFTSAAGAPGGILYSGTPWGDVQGSLAGSCQVENATTVFNALVALSEHFDITPEAVRRGFAQVEALSGLRGRWSRLDWQGRHFIYDTGHNEGAWRLLGPQLAALGLGRRLKMVVGFLRDKDVGAIIPYMPADADYFFVAPDSGRAATAAETAQAFAAAGIAGRACADVDAGLRDAMEASAPGDTVFVGGSTFTVSAFLAAVG